MSDPANIAVVDSPVGPLTIEYDGNGISRLDYGRDGRRSANNSIRLPKVIQKQIDAYFLNGHSKFNLSLCLQGTPFQKKVWRLLQTIPPGQMLTYGEIARRLNTSARAVGNACRANPVSLIVPCHRVVAAHGLGGFGGKTRGPRLSIKAWLLRHEGAIKD